MSDLMEVPIDNWMAAFDGRVLEVFTPYRNGSMRYYVQFMEDCKIDGKILTVTFQRSETGLWPFNDDQLPGVEKLVAAINKARGV